MALYFWLCLSALGGGAINAIAGGGTLVTFPALLTVISPVAANVTSTLALLPGSVASAWGYRRELHSARRWILLLTIPSLLGGITGALLITKLPEAVFKILVPWLVLLAALLFLLQPAVTRLMKRHAHPTARHGPPSGSTRAAVIVCQFFVGVYGGYFGAGIGILMLSALSFLDLEGIHQMNALKTWLAFCINGISAVLFIIDGQIVWPFALCMAVAAIAGGYLGARWALRLPPVYVRWLVIAIGFFLAGYFFVKQARETSDEGPKPYSINFLKSSNR
jgi:uncharacterized membrane protein YfcA